MDAPQPKWAGTIAPKILGPEYVHTKQLHFPCWSDYAGGNILRQSTMPRP